MDKLQEKPQKEKEVNARQKFALKILTVIIAILVLSIFLLFFKIDKLSKKPQKIIDQEWLFDNCECVEWNSTLECPAGFELRNRTCVNEIAYTNALRSCSKYQCPEYFVDVIKNSSNGCNWISFPQS